MLKFLRIILVLTLLNLSTAEKILVIPFFNTSLTMMANSIANQLYIVIIRSLGSGHKIFKLKKYSTMPSIR